MTTSKMGTPAPEIRRELAAAWLAWEDDEQEFFASEAVYDLVALLRGSPDLTGADALLLRYWDRYLTDPHRLLPPEYLHRAFHSWIDSLAAEGRP